MVRSLADRTFQPSAGQLRRRAEELRGVVVRAGAVRPGVARWRGRLQVEALAPVEGCRALCDSTEKEFFFVRGDQLTSSSILLRFNLKIICLQCMKL